MTELIRVRDVTIIRATRFDAWRQTDEQLFSGANANLAVFTKTIRRLLEQVKHHGHASDTEYFQLCVTAADGSESWITPPVQRITRTPRGLSFNIGEQNYILESQSKQDEIIIGAAAVGGWEHNSCLLMLPLVFVSEIP